MEKQTLFLNAMTDRGYMKLIEVLNGLGYQLPSEPNIRVTPMMHSLAEEVLKRKIKLHPYEEPFIEETSPEEKEELERMNNFLGKLAVVLNSGGNYNLQELEFSTGIELETAKELEKMFLRSLKTGK